MFLENTRLAAILLTFALAAAACAAPSAEKTRRPAAKTPPPAKTAPSPTAGTTAPGPLRIGEINSYKTRPGFLEPYRQGWQLALDEINAQGGVLGRPLEIVPRDGGGTPQGALQAAQHLVEREKIDAFFGGHDSETGLALADYAAQKRRFYLATLPMSSQIVWERGNAYTYRLAPSTWMQIAALAPKALGLRQRRWALVYPGNEYGQASAATFRAIVTGFQSRTEIAANLAVPPGRANIAEIAQRLADARPDAIFSALHGDDLIRFAREGAALGLFQNRAVVAALAGRPETRQALGAAMPEGWIVTGGTCEESVDTPAHRRFIAAFRQRHGAAPGAGATLGYIAMHAMAAGLRKAGAAGANPQALAQAFSGLEFDSPYGLIRFRAIDHQSTLGVCLESSGIEDGRAMTRPLGYFDGARLQPIDKVVRRLRAN